MKTLLFGSMIALSAAAAFAQPSFSDLTLVDVTGKNGIQIGFDPANDVLIRANFGNPPVIEVLNPADFSVQSTLPTAGPTYGGIAGFGMGVGEDGFIVINDHNETGDTSETGLVAWDDINDTTPELITAPAAVDGILNGVYFARDIEVIGTGTNRSIIPTAAEDEDTASPRDEVFILRFNSASSLYEPVTLVNDIENDPTQFGIQRGIAAAVGNGTVEFPEFIYGANDSTSTGLLTYQSDGATSYSLVNTLGVPAEAPNTDQFKDVAIDEGFAATLDTEGEAPVAIVAGEWNDSENPDAGSALYMFNLNNGLLVATLPFDATNEFDVYGSIALDKENNIVYFSIRNGTDSTIGSASYTPPALFFETDASSWELYQ